MHVSDPEGRVHCAGLSPDGGADVNGDLDQDLRRLEVAVRTLIAAGFAITGNQRQPRHSEIACERVDVFGTTIRYLVILTDQGALSEREIADAERAAAPQGRALVIVAREPGPSAGASTDFIAALGGAVPSWRALGARYRGALLTAARNQLPPGASGESWLVFEDLVADGIEFALARRILRLGGRKRGRPLSDMIARTPDEGLVVVDAKAAQAGFSVQWDALRPLVEYVARQRDRQRGNSEVIGAMIVSSAFAQSDQALTEISRRFQGEARVPLSFLAAETLASTVEALSTQSELRSAVRWSRVLLGGRILLDAIRREIEAARVERMPRGR